MPAAIEGLRLTKPRVFDGQTLVLWNKIKPISPPSQGKTNPLQPTMLIENIVIYETHYSHITNVIARCQE